MSPIWIRPISTDEFHIVPNLDDSPAALCSGRAALADWTEIDPEPAVARRCKACVEAVRFVGRGVAA